jgi:uncharacterized protein (TIGR00255 family)
MTGFAQARAESNGAAVMVTLKALNHRFLDLHVRLPVEAEPLQADVEKRIRQTLKRGRIDVSVSVEGTAAIAMRIDERVASAYVSAYRQLANQLGIADASPDLNEILRFPGVLSSTAPEEAGGAARLQPLLIEATERSLAQLDHMRLTEGETLLRDLQARLGVLRSAVEQIAASRDLLRQTLHERLRKRVLELAADQVDASRLAQEAALLAERSDISEEITRFSAHLEQFAAALRDGGEIGKKLDFLLQEMNREVNTMLSKTSGIVEGGLEISQAGVQMKTEIEKIREQVQNIE